MARLPSWRDNLPQSFTGARKWGTGINPIHSQHWDQTPGRELSTHDPLPSQPYTGMHDESLVSYDEWGMGADESAMEGMGGLYYHPSWQDHGIRAKTDGFPNWGPGGDPLPGGTAIRSRKWATSWRETHVNAQVQGQAGDGWVNKEYDPVPLDSKPSDPSQYEIWTSMVQINQTKSNDSAVLRGTDDARTPIPSRIIGMRKKVWPGGSRHDDMFPYQQEGWHRPFRYRTAGTGPAHWMTVNEMYVSEPIQRELPPDVNMGQSETSYYDGTDTIGEDFYYG